MNAPQDQPIANSQQKYRRELLLNIYRMLSSNGQNARPVYFGLSNLPKGGMNELARIRPYDAVRAEIGGTTLTIEVTTNRQGEQNDPDALRYACYDLNDFKAWFFTLLYKAGIQPEPPANVPEKIVWQFMHFASSTQIRADLRSAPYIHHRKKKR